MRRDLPSGTVTFLFTDVEGSTRLLHELGAEGYAEALAEHRRVIREACASGGGVEVDTQGDAFFFAFPTAPGALQAASSFTESLASGQVQVRVGLHTGTPLLTNEGYVGDDVHFAARVAATAHGGQVVLSASTAEFVDGSLTDLGEHRLKDIAEAVPIFQLGDGSFPPLKTVSNTNLPRPASSFVGREREVEEVRDLLADGTRLLTLTGPGGTGKTRLAIEAAATLVPEYKAGVFWVGLATLRDHSLVTETIAQTLGSKNGLAEHIGERELLLLLDNLEQVVESAPELSTLVSSCPNLTLLCTSRELLRVSGEVEYAVPPLAEPEAVSLFCERAQAEPTDDVAELCVRLDALPLALELAAARTKVLSPGQILERLSTRLDLLEGGRDAEGRQKTLRATIDWSYELLSTDEQQLFGRLSVFRGGCRLGAAEEVCAAGLDTLQSLVEKSLVRFADERYWMLETIREYAAERFADSGEAGVIRRRHAAWYAALAASQRAVLEAGEPEEGPVSVLSADIDNLRAAVDWGLETGEPSVVREVTASLYMYWVMRGLYTEARSSLERALALDPAPDPTRRRLLSALGTIAYSQGDHVAATAASDEAAALAAELEGATEQLALLRERAVKALANGELEEAEVVFTERLDAAQAAGNGVATSSCRLNLATIANRTGRHDRAVGLLAENLVFVRSKGQARCEAYTLAGQADTAVHAGRGEEAADDALLAATRALQISDLPLVAYALDLAAASAAARGDVATTGMLLAATARARRAMGVECDEDEEAIRASALANVDEQSTLFADAWRKGEALELDAVLGLVVETKP